MDKDMCPIVVNCLKMIPYALEEPKIEFGQIWIKMAMN